jgi:hypothetical protein
MTHALKITFTTVIAPAIMPRMPSPKDMEPTKQKNRLRHFQ